MRDLLGQRVAGRCAVLAVDLGRFSRVTDLAGHAGGEDLLRQAAARLTTVAGSNDLVARLAGDDYALLVKGADGDEAKALGDEILDTLAQPFDVGGVPIQLSPSVGVACYPDDGACAEDLLRYMADAAYWAKRRGRNRAVRFEARLHKELVGRQLMERDLRLAIANAGFQLEWRPTACVATGRLVGFDALIRWDRPGHGAVAADLLAMAAESSGLASALDRWLLDAACRAASQWRAPLRVCVRMLASSFRQADLPATVARALRDCALPANRLQIEVGAQSFVDPTADMARHVEQVRSLGVEVVINDFGSGVTTVAGLLDIKFDVIKLSGEMVGAAARGGRSEAVAASVIRLAKSLGERVCATGVQSGVECAFLLEHGCDELQGKLVDRLAPITLDPMLEWARVALPDRLAVEDPRAAIHGIAAAVVASTLIWVGLHQLFTLVA